MSNGYARYAYPKFKVFIFGIDVTNDVISINSTQHDGKAPNTCQITLLNEFDKFIITTSDMVHLNKGKIELKNGQLNIPWLNNLSNQATDAASSGQYTVVSPIGDENFEANLNAAYDNGLISFSKKEILLKKNKEVQKLSKDTMETILEPIHGTKFTNYYSQYIKRYPMADGMSIFHPMDPVRVFMRDPFRPERWYHYFCGFVSDISEDTDKNNEKTLTLVVEDPTKLLRYSRIFINPGILDANSIIQKEDFSIQSFYASPLQNMTLTEAFFTILFGPEKVDAQNILQKMRGAQKTANVPTRINGVGHFSFDTSGVFAFGPESDKPRPEDLNPRDILSRINLVDTFLGVESSREAKIQVLMEEFDLNRADAESLLKSAEREPETKLLEKKPIVQLPSLAAWQSIIDHEVRPSDMFTMAYSEYRQQNRVDLFDLGNQTYAANGVEGIVDYIGAHPEIYLVDGGRLLMLLPRSLGVHNTSVISNDIMSGTYPMQSEWHSAGSILTEVIDRIDFVMYCSPRGDIIVEPPLYDMDPSHFSWKDKNKGISSSEFNELMSSLDKNRNTKDDSAISILSMGEQHMPGGVHGPFDTNYIVLKRDTLKWSAAFIDEKVHNIAVCAKSIFHNYDALPNTSIVGDLAVVKIPHLIPLYGARQIILNPRGFISTTNGANYYCHIQLNKMNADAHTLRVDMIPNIHLWINRPIYFQGRNCISTVKQIQHSLTWGESGDMSTSIDLWATRAWEGIVAKKDHSRPLYSPIGSWAGRPTDYSLMMGVKDEPLLNEEDMEAQVQEPNIDNAVSNISPAADTIAAKHKKTLPQPKNAKRKTPKRSK